jgi:hypothetical protein
LTYVKKRYAQVPMKVPLVYPHSHRAEAPLRAPAKDSDHNARRADALPLVLPEGKQNLHTAA